MKKTLSLLLLIGLPLFASAQSSEQKAIRISNTDSINRVAPPPTTPSTGNTPTDNTGEDARKWLNNFYAGLGALGDKGVGELGITLRRFELYLATKVDTVTVIDQNGTPHKEIRERDINIGFNFLNRASINFDSLKFIANNYLLSLNPSPFTLRIDHSFYFTKNREIEIGKKSKPVVGLQLQADGRAIPFANKGGSVDIGGSFNLFGTLFFQFKSYEKQGNQTKDQGTFYIEPTFYFALTSKSLTESITPNRSKGYITGLDFKIGFRSESNSINDIGLSGFYTWNEVEGPQFRIGLSIKPN